MHLLIGNNYLKICVRYNEDELRLVSVLPALNEVWVNVDETPEECVALIHQAVKAKFRGVDTIYGETMDGGKYVVVRKRKGN